MSSPSYKCPPPTPEDVNEEVPITRSPFNFTAWLEDAGFLPMPPAPPPLLRETTSIAPSGAVSRPPLSDAPVYSGRTFTSHLVPFGPAHDRDLFSPLPTKWRHKLEHWVDTERIPPPPMLERQSAIEYHVPGVVGPEDPMQSATPYATVDGLQEVETEDKDPAGTSVVQHQQVVGTKEEEEEDSQYERRFSRRIRDKRYNRRVRFNKNTKPY